MDEHPRNISARWDRYLNPARPYDGRDKKPLTGRPDLPRPALGPAYTYTAVVTKVTDGDTFRAHVDVGFTLWLHHQSFRLHGCNARELAQDGGKEARDRLATLMPVGSLVILRSIAEDKYRSRYGAQVFLADGTDLVAQLLDEGWVAPWSGLGERPIPPWPRLHPA